MNDYLRKTAALLRLDIKNRLAPRSKSAKVSVRVVTLKNIFDSADVIVIAITEWNGAVFRDEFVEWVMEGERATRPDGSVSHEIPGIFLGKHGTDPLDQRAMHAVGAVFGPAQLDRYGMECFDELAVLHPALVEMRDALRERARLTALDDHSVIVDLYQIKRDAIQGLRDERDGSSKHAAQQAKDARKAAHPHVRVKLEHRTAHGEEMIEFRCDASPRLVDLIAATDDINRAIADATYACLAPFEPKRSEATVQVVYGRWVVIVMANCKSGAAAALGVTR